MTLHTCMYVCVYKQCCKPNLSRHRHVYSIQVKGALTGKKLKAVSCGVAHTGFTHTHTYVQPSSTSQLQQSYHIVPPRLHYLVIFLGSRSTTRYLAASYQHRVPQWRVCSILVVLCGMIAATIIEVPLKDESVFPEMMFKVAECTTTNSIDFYLRVTQHQ